MKQITLVGSLLLALLTVPAMAQITLEASFLESGRGHQFQGSVYLMDVQSYPSLTSLLNAIGPGQTYDFTAFSYGFPTGVAYNVLSSAAGTPGEADPDFSGANWVQKQTEGGTFYSYYALQDDGFYFLGSIFVQATDTDGNGVLDQSVQKNAPPDPTYKFPMTDGSAWHQVVVSTTEGFSSTSQVTSTVDFAVEGWGTLLTPAGSAPALRLRKTLSVEGAGIEGYTTTTYLFITNSMLGASIFLNGQGDVVLAAYNVDSGGTTEVEEAPLHTFRLEENYPNPFSKVTHVPFELDQPGYVTLSVFDLMGREVGSLVNASLPVGSYTTDFVADGLPNGVYFYRLQVHGTTSVRALVLRR